MSNVKTQKSISENIDKLVKQAFIFIDKMGYGNFYDSISKMQFNIDSVDKKNQSIHIAITNIPYIDITSCISYNRLFGRINYLLPQNAEYLEYNNKWQRHLLTCDDNDLALDAAIVIKEECSDKLPKLTTENDNLFYRKELLTYLYQQNKNNFSTCLNKLTNKELEEECFSDMADINSVFSNKVKDIERRIKDNYDSIEENKQIIELCNNIITLKNTEKSNEEESLQK